MGLIQWLRRVGILSRLCEACAKAGAPLRRCQKNMKRLRLTTEFVVEFHRQATVCITLVFYLRACQIKNATNWKPG